MHQLTLFSLAVALAACAPPEQKFTVLTPSVSVAPEVLEFGEVVPGLAISRDLAVLSSGRRTLEITDIRLEPADGAIVLDWTMPDEGLVELPASDTLNLPISFEPTDFVSYAASLVIESNDGENPELIVDITALRRGQRDLAIGDVFGSSLVDATLSIGIGPIVAPTFVDQALGVRGGLVALGAVLFVTVLLGLRRRHTRLTGVVLIGLYLVMTMVIAVGG